MGISTEDIVRIVAACLYIITSAVLGFLCMIMYRHNLSNRTKEYIERYKNYINTLCVLACGGFFLFVGNVVSLIDQGETDLPTKGKESQWGWWIAFTLFLITTLMSISKYHRLTNYEELTIILMSASTGATFVFLSRTGSADGLILWTVLLFASVLVTHFFLLWKSQRVYALRKTHQERGYTRYFGHVTADIGLIVLSMVMSALVGLTLALGPEVYDVISTAIATEAMYATFIIIYYVATSIFVFHMFMDINDELKVGQVLLPGPPDRSTGKMPSYFGAIPKRIVEEMFLKKEQYV